MVSNLKNLNSQNKIKKRYNLKRYNIKGNPFSNILQSVRFGNFINESEPVLAFSDTGNPYMQAPEYIVRQIYEELGVIQATLEIPCDMEYEPIIFKIAGQEYKLTKVYNIMEWNFLFLFIRTKNTF